MTYHKCLTALLAVLFAAASTLAGLWKSSNYVSVDEGRIHSGDLYITSRNADIEGTVQGDLIVGCQILSITGDVLENFYGAGQIIRIDGDVYGDVLAFAQDISLKGACGSSVRGCAETVYINGEVAGDVLVGGREIIIGPQAVIEGSLYAGCQTLTIEGVIKGMVKAGAEEVEIGGEIRLSSEITTDKLTFREGGRIGDNLTITSREPLDDDFQSHVMGRVIYKKLAVDKDKCPFALIGGLWWLLASLVFAFIFIALFKNHYRENCELFYEKPWTTMLIGLLGLIVAPIAVIISIALVLTIPVGIVLGGVYLILLYIGWIAASILWGTLIMRLFGASEPSLFLSALIGVTVVVLLSMVPFLGCLVSFATVVTGLGFIMMGIRSQLIEGI